MPNLPKVILLANVRNNLFYLMPKNLLDLASNNKDKNPVHKRFLQDISLPLLTVQKLINKKLKKLKLSSFITAGIKAFLDTKKISNFRKAKL
ncbi:MAG TPA: hypothetical protein PK006_07700 [Saprospiraceae bacterium]|nr:hypothetical protein [Saprospiraceae bacterium]